VPPVVLGLRASAAAAAAAAGSGSARSRRGPLGRAGALCLPHRVRVCVNRRAPSLRSSSADHEAVAVVGRARARARGERRPPAAVCAEASRARARMMRARAPRPDGCAERLQPAWRPGCAGLHSACAAPGRAERRGLLFSACCLLSAVDKRPPAQPGDSPRCSRGSVATVSSRHDREGGVGARQKEGAGVQLRVARRLLLSVLCARAPLEASRIDQYRIIWVSRSVLSLSLSLSKKRVSMWRWHRAGASGGRKRGAARRCGSIARTWRGGGAHVSCRAVEWVCSARARNKIRRGPLRSRPLD